MKAEVLYFPKKCIHGEPMRVVEKGLRKQYWWYETIDCSKCKEEDLAEEREYERKTEAFLKRLKKRREVNGPVV